MARFLGVVRCKGGWGVAQLELRGERRSIELSVLKRRGDIPRAKSAAGPDALNGRRTAVCAPDACFAALQGGRPPAVQRRTLHGRKERWALIQVVFPGLPMPRAPKGMSEADVLDALVLAWAAQEVAAGRYTRTPAGEVVPGRFRLVP